MARHNQPVIFTPFTLAGAMAPITVAGALVAAERRGAGRHRVRPVRPPGLPGGLRQLHLQRRHEERGARLRHARIRQGHDRLRPARAPLPAAVPGLERQRLERARRPVGLRIRDVDLALRAGAHQHRQAQPRLARGRAHDLLREDHPRRRDAADDRGVSRTARHRRGRAGASMRSARSAPAAISSRRRTRWRATSTPSTRRCSPTGATSRPGRRRARSTPPSARTGSGRRCSPPTSRRRSTPRSPRRSRPSSPGARRKAARRATVEIPPEAGPWTAACGAAARRIGLLPGDAAGIGPEITARLLASEQLEPGGRDGRDRRPARLERGAASRRRRARAADHRARRGRAGRRRRRCCPARRSTPRRRRSAR